LEVGIEEMARLGGEEFGQTTTDAVLGLIPERARRGGVDRLQNAVRVVGADETQTVLNKVAVAPLALLEGVPGLLPGCGDLVERRALPIVDRCRRMLVHLTPVLSRTCASGRPKISATGA